MSISQGAKVASNHRSRHLPTRVELEEVEPWPEPVEGKVLLRRLKEEVERFLAVPKWAAVTIALWILHTYAYRLREVTTYLAIESPERECGKSTLLIVLSKFVNRAVMSANISPSAFFHAIQELDPTLLIDEGQANLRARHELRAIFNAGYTKSTAYVWRLAHEPAGAGTGGNGDGAADEGWAGPSQGTLVRYSSWCPKAIAMIGHWDETLASRCIVIRMQRKTDAEACERLKMVRSEELKRQCARFVQDHAAEIASAEPVMPKGLMNRAADVWEQLLVLADLAGGEWPELARNAAVGLTLGAQQHSPIGALLLDIFVQFILAQRDRLFSREIVAGLNQDEDRPWATLRKGKAVSVTWLAAQLGPYGIGPRTMRVGDEIAKGYYEEDFKEVFKRYVSMAEVEAFKAELQARAVKEGPKEGGEK